MWSQQGTLLSKQVVPKVESLWKSQNKTVSRESKYQDSLRYINGYLYVYLHIYINIYIYLRDNKEEK